MQRKTDYVSISALAKRVLRGAPRTSPRLSANMSQGEQSARSARYAQRVARQEKRAAENDSTNNKQGETSDANHEMQDQVSADDESDESDEPDESDDSDDGDEADMLHCTICLEVFPETETVEVPCGHDLCKPCIIWCVERAIAHEALFPPKCCQQEIPIEVNSFLSHDLVDRFEQKRLEYETVNRTYCSNQRCLKFIPPFCIDDGDAICNDCGDVTCATCRAAAHAGPCASDPQTLSLLALAEREGWKRCTKCGRVIELSLGCNSMQCVCGFEFCYLCGISASVGCDCIIYGVDAVSLTMSIDPFSPAV
ncbi:hypothetical protein HG530_009458 [Fusarium avenaceum]|nr:hypothetical protein HG530_009458 [Fusarium avenaceum]